MQQIVIQSLAIGTVIGCSKYFRDMGIGYLHIDKGVLTGSSTYYDILVQVGFSTFEEGENKLSMTVAASLENERLLKVIDQGASGSIEVSSQGNGYMFDSDLDQIQISKIEVVPHPQSISGIATDTNKRNNSLTITSKAELSMTGKEDFIALGVYGGQLSSTIVPGNTEHFIVEGSREQMKMLPREFYKSYSFLKFGTPEFELQLYKSENDIWLSTTGNLADKVPFTVLEKLTKHMENRYV